MKCTGLNRGSLYTAFEGKRGLFLECLSHYDHRYRGKFLKSAACNCKPREEIIEAFQAASQSSHETGHPTGYLLVNTGLEVSPHDPEVRERVNASLARVETFFRINLDAAQADGSVSSRIDAAEMSKVLLNLFLGLRVTVRTQLGDTAVRAVINQVRTLLAQDK